MTNLWGSVPLSLIWTPANVDPGVIPSRTGVFPFPEPMLAVAPDV
jgi:hypothetical protein